MGGGAGEGVLSHSFNNKGVVEEKKRRRPFPSLQQRQEADEVDERMRRPHKNREKTKDHDPNKDRSRRGRRR